ncbi:putative bifunctional P-450/NADPH-P450 reductase 2 [Variibacter gotjawalensis]|uniref:Bifunctional cytochrome P450/NADPH--P450 reductase n=1 Tax=Variibacter gotjawalensis TaxID=1333996 RepID=A0A0S3Q061_9BRAD|nr:cytochrome P450 [Variibacter gotjawalensis]NIK47198.1 cytochrome P450/NADPH-cytochrome P450 reductase [Variibacter gotjawalensis]RZS49098.1 cytochrome P450/NADPH-cytochrome P450 reductase [Variibacter gotjawalensis]BAT61360.1 putative bifunctional P-450/NADPH-P450 reductase 2 [Variibacter gotjawalensis]
MSSKTNPLHPIPKLPGKMLIGNLLSVDAEQPIQDLMRIASEQGPIFWMDMMGKPIVVISGADLLDEVCDETRFDKSTRGVLRRLRPAAHGLFTADTEEEKWSLAHNILMPTFAQRAMQGYHPMMLDIAEQMMAKWERLNPDDEIDVTDDMTRLTLDTIGLCGFDYRFNSFYRDGNHPFIDAMVRTLEATMQHRGLPFEEVFKSKQLKQVNADIKYMHKMVGDIIRERRENLDTQGDKKDLLNFMLQGVDKKTGQRLSDEQIRDETIIFLIAGHETTSGMLSFATYALLNNPDVLAKAYAEVDRVLGGDISVKPTYAQVNQLTYIGQILKEALRLWPTAPAFALRALENTTVGGEYKIKKSYHVMALIAQAHRDKSVWGPRADVFDPENFSREAEANRPPNAYKPFGNGQRACIGRQFAMQEATLVMGMILQRFKLHDPHRYKLSIKETLTVKPEGFKIKVRARTDRPKVTPGYQVAATTAKPKAAAKPAPKVASHGTPLLVLFGSNLGTAEEFARSIAEGGEANGFETKLASLDDYENALPRNGATVIVCGSYNGTPPDNAVSFAKWLENEMNADALKGVNYTLFGCGNRDWLATYQSVPRHLDERLKALGATEVYPRGEGDAREDLDGQFQDWYKKLWPKLAKELKIDADLSKAAKAAPLYELDYVPAPAPNTIVASTGAQKMRITANRELQKRDGDNASDRSTRHIEIELPDGVNYRAGDHLMVIPSNSRALVERVMDRFGIAPDTHIRLDVAEGRRASLPTGQTLPVYNLLADYVELQGIATRKQIQTLADNTRCPHTKPQLQALAAEDGEKYKTEVFQKRKSVLDLLEEFPACELPFNLFLEMLPLIVPRYYSISSSPKLDPKKASITVGVVEGPARSGNGVYRGVCSNHLLRQGPGSVVQGIVKETKVGFRLPDDLSTPIVMIGPGTGLAPFRAFMQERAAAKKKGKKLGTAMLFFGCRHPDQDFIYGDELKQLAKDSDTELHIAFSRHNGKKTYVQDLIKAEGTKIKKLFRDGAIVYVCGDGSRMEPDVKKVLAAMYGEETGSSEDNSLAWVDKMTSKNRYVLDVWVGS